MTDIGKCFILLSLTGVLCAGRAAEANAVVLETDTVSFSGESPEGEPLLYLPRYSGVGTLTEVDFLFTSSVGVAGSFSLASNKPITFTLTEDALVEFHAAADAPAALSSVGQFAPEPYSAAPLSYFLVGTQSFSVTSTALTVPFGPFSNSGQERAAFTAPNDLSGFVGNTSYSFQVNYSYAQAISYNPALNNTYVLSGAGFSVSSLYAGAVTVTYAGDLPVAGVPEPSSWAMTILGFAGFGCMAYLRRSVPIHAA